MKALLIEDDPVTSGYLLKALGETNRLSLVCRLCECEAPQQAMCLCACCSVDASGVSRHLKILAQEGIVSVERSGRQRNYSLNRTFVGGHHRARAEPAPRRAG